MAKPLEELGPEERTSAIVTRADAPTVLKRPFALELIRGPGSPRRYILELDEVVIGRAEGVDVRIDSEGLSRRHIRLLRSSGEYFCEDLESRNGVYLNGVKIHSATLRDGDQLQLGSVVLLYREGD